MTEDSITPTVVVSAGSVPPCRSASDILVKPGLVAVQPVGFNAPCPGGNYCPGLSRGALATHQENPHRYWCKLMSIKVGRVPDLNHEPFYFDMESRGIQLHQVASGSLGPAVEKGEIDGGPIPLTDCFRLEDRFQYVTGFCLAARGKSGSIFLHSRQPVVELQGASIGIPSENANSVDLLRVLLTFKYQVQPKAYVAPEDPHEAILLEGDQGLRRRRGVRGYPHRYDLGEEWTRWTGLPFVLARWMMRQDMDTADEALLENTLYVGLEEGVDALFHLSEPRENVLMLAKDVLEYIQGYRYFMGLSEYKSVALFREYLGQLPSVKP